MGLKRDLYSIFVTHFFCKKPYCNCLRLLIKDCGVKRELRVRLLVNLGILSYIERKFKKNRKHFLCTCDAVMKKLWLLWYVKDLRLNSYHAKF